MAMLHYVDDRPIVLTERGRWEQGGEPLHPKVATLFSAHIVPVTESGFEIRIGHQRQTIEVRDCGFFIRSMHLDRHTDGHLVAVRAQLSDGTHETLDPSTFEQGSDGVLYVRIERHGFRTRCRFSSSQYHELALEVVPSEDESDSYQIEIGQRFWPFGLPMDVVNIAVA